MGIRPWPYNINISAFNVLTSKEEEKEINMNKEQFFVVGAHDLPMYETYEVAEEKAKRALAAKSLGMGSCSYLILKSVASVKAPIPEAVVTKFA